MGIVLCALFILDVLVLAMPIGLKLDAFFVKYRPEYFGIIGCLIIGVGCIIAAAGFAGYQGEPYSLLNHFISELGSSESATKWAFNYGLMVGAPAILIFLVGTRILLHSRIADLGRIMGIVTGIGGFLVGVFPGDVDPVAHAYSGQMFFFGGTAAVGILSIAIARQTKVVLDKWLAIIGLVVVASFSIYLGYIFTNSLAVVAETSALAESRPAIMPSAYLEWLPLIGVLAWLFLSALDSLKLNPLQNSLKVMQKKT